MAEVENVFENTGKSIKKFLKDNPFIVLCIVVGIIALILWWIRQKNAQEADAGYYDGSQAIGYGGYGYPTVGAAEDGDNLDWYYNKIDSLTDEYDQKVSDLDEMYQQKFSDQEDKWTAAIDALQSKYDELYDKYDDLLNQDPGDYEYQPGGYASGGSKLDIQAIIDQMEYNSNLWWDVTNKAGRDALHAENHYLGSLIGAEYDGKTGVWSIDGVPIYNVDKGDAMKYATGTGSKSAPNGNVSYVANVDYQSAINNAIKTGASASTINTLNAQRNAKIAAQGKTTQSANVSYDKNTDYQALINQAKASGADQSVIDNLTAQRNAKIKGENLNADGSKKTPAVVSNTAKKAVQKKPGEVAILPVVKPKPEIK